MIERAQDRIDSAPVSLLIGAVVFGKHSGTGSLLVFICELSPGLG